MMCKNLPMKELAWKLPARFALDAISAWKGLFSGDTYYFTAIVKAHFSLFAFALTGKIKRSPVTKSLNAIDGVFPGSLVFQYFVKKKQYFNKIIG